MTKENVVEKIKKLLLLTESDNPHEAANAAARAQELMLKYAVEQHELEGSSAKHEPIDVEGLGVTTKKIPRWQGALAHILSKHFFCKTFTVTGVDIKVVGRQTDRDVFKATFFYLRGEIIRMSEAAWETETTDVHGKTWKASFCLGAVNTIQKRLMENLNRLLTEGENAPAPVAGELTGAAPTPSTAIVLRTRLEEVEGFVKEKIGKMHKLGSRVKSRDAYSQGQEAGHLIDIKGRGPWKPLPGKG